MPAIAAGCRKALTRIVRAREAGRVSTASLCLHGSAPRPDFVDNVKRGVMGKRITALDVLGEVRRAQRILKRVRRYLEQSEKDAARRIRKARERAVAAAGPNPFEEIAGRL